MRRSPLYEASLLYAITVALAVLVFFFISFNLSATVNQTMTLATLLAMPAFTLWAILAAVMRRASELARFAAKLFVTALVVFGGVGFILSAISNASGVTEIERTDAYNSWLLQGWTFGLASVIAAIVLHFVLPLRQNQNPKRK